MDNSSNTRVTFLDSSRSSSPNSSFSETEFLLQEEGRAGRPSPAARNTSYGSMGNAMDMSLSNHGSVHLRMSRRHEDVDEDILHRAAADAGLGSMGTVYVEVWTLSQDGTKLSRPDGGYWMDPVFHNPDAEECGCCGTLQCSACRISDPDHPNFLPADPVAPGVGFAGVLWSESVSVEDTSVVGGILKESNQKRKIVWRDLQAMKNNPHLPFDERLRAIADCGLGWAAAVPFHINHHKGIVIYCARQNVDHGLLTEDGNELYLTCAADLIGSAWALREPRRLAMANRKAKRVAAIRRARIKILFLIRMGFKFDRPIEERPSQVLRRQKELERQKRPLCQKIKEKVQEVSTAAAATATLVAKKCRGSNNKPPPPFSTEQAVFTFWGSLFLLTFLSAFNEMLLLKHGKEYLLLMPPMGAFICLQFALTQAPAAQPRNCLAGQVLSISIALACSILPFLPIWSKQALGTALALGAMARTGLTHPPAGASAFLFASGQYGMTHLAVLLVANILTIFLGSVINNMSEKRQYPTYYAMGLNPRDMIAYLKK